MTDMTYHQFSRRDHDQVPLSHATAATGRASSNAVRGVAHWYRVRSTAKTLNELESRMLRDIGISRSEVPAVARFVVDNPAADPRTAGRALAARRHDR